MEEKSEDSPSKKKFGKGGVNMKIFEQKSGNTREGGRGGKFKNLVRSLEIWLIRPYMKREGI